MATNGSGEHGNSSTSDRRLDSLATPGIAAQLLDLFRMRQELQTRNELESEQLTNSNVYELDFGPTYDFDEQLGGLSQFWDGDLRPAEGAPGGDLSDMLLNNGSPCYPNPSYDQEVTFPLPGDPLQSDPLEASHPVVLSPVGARFSDEELRELLLREEAEKQFQDNHLAGQHNGGQAGGSGASRRGLKRTLGALQPLDGAFANELGATAERSKMEVNQLLAEMDMLLPEMIPAQYPAGLMAQGGVAGQGLRHALDTFSPAGNEWGATVADNQFHIPGFTAQSRAPEVSCSNSDDSSGASRGLGVLGSVGARCGPGDGENRRPRRQKKSVDPEHLNQFSGSQPLRNVGPEVGSNGQARVQDTPIQLSSRRHTSLPAGPYPSNSTSMSAGFDPNGSFSNGIYSKNGVLGGGHGYPPPPTHKPGRKGGRGKAPKAGSRPGGAVGVLPANPTELTSQSLTQENPTRWQFSYQARQMAAQKGQAAVMGAGAVTGAVTGAGGGLGPPSWTGLGGEGGVDFDPSAQDPPLRPAGSQLGQMLINCAEFIDDGEMRSAHSMMQILNSMVTPHGTAEQRMAFYFLEGLAARMVGTGSNIYQSLQSRSGTEPGPGSKEMLTALLKFVESCPYANFGHEAANNAILEAVEGEGGIHIIDFGITHGTQWPTFIESLASRAGVTPRLRITCVDAPQTGLKPSSLQETGRRLTSFAKLYGVPFEFHPVTEHLETLQATQFDLRPGEVLAVSCVLRLHQVPDETGGLTSASPRNSTLNVIRQLNPKIVILVEQHTDHNLLSFRARFREALHYFSAVFDSVDCCLPWNSTERVMVEERVLGRKIVNIVACEGADRVEQHESLARWQFRMQQAGFRAVGVSTGVVENLKALLRKYAEGYGLDNVNKAILLTWRGQQLLAASLWTCADLES